MSSDLEARRLPPDWSAYLRSQPETGMDYQTGDVVLRDGTRVRDVIFVGGAYVGEVRGQKEVPFRPEEIAKIRLTHRRWK